MQGMRLDDEKSTVKKRDQMIKGVLWIYIRVGPPMNELLSARSIKCVLRVRVD